MTSEPETGIGTRFKNAMYKPLHELAHEAVDVNSGDRHPFDWLNNCLIVIIYMLCYFIAAFITIIVVNQLGIYLGITSIPASLQHDLSTALLSPVAIMMFALGLYLLKGVASVGTHVE